MDPDYEWLALLVSDEAFELRRARSVRTGAALLVKTALAIQGRGADIAALRREAALAAELSSAATLLPRITQQRDGVALIMEDPGGIGLAQLLAQGRLEPALALGAALQLAGLLAELHARGMLHNAIRPDAVLCDPKRKRAWWVDLGSATDAATQGRAQAALGAARLVYASPECAGRIDAGADARSDLYSFGVLLYEMLTGAPPFQSDDALTLIHLHVAGSAAPPARRCAEVPAALSDIVMKLLSKAADERYQSANGLVHDLERCARELSARARIDPFALGRHDVPRQLVLGSRLLGRDAEVQLMLDAFEAACEPERAGTKVLPEVMIPLIAYRAEFDILREVIVQTALAVEQETGTRLDYQIGTMIELPRAALQAHEIAHGDAGAEFFSFGTNDLTQTCLGLSRDDAAPILANYTQRAIFEVDPFVSIDIDGVGELVRIGTERGRKVREDLKVGICGEHGGDPASIAFCHEVGLNYVSCSPFRVPVARLAAAQAALRAKHGSEPTPE